MEIRVSLNTTGVTKMTRLMAQDQLPYATSVALNDVARRAQKAQHEYMAGAFKVTRPGWTLRSVKHKPRSTKRQLWTVLKIEPPGGRQRADILSKFEDGGTKRPTTGTRLAIPGAGLRRTTSGAARRGQRPKDFNFKHHGGNVYVGEKRTFMIRNPDGSGAIYQRIGRGNARSSTKTKRMLAGTRLLYTFARSVRIDDRLKLEDTATAVVNREWPAAFNRSFENAMRTAR